MSVSTVTRLVELRPTDNPAYRWLSPAIAESVAHTVVNTGKSAVIVRTPVPYLLLGPKDRRLPRLHEAVRWAHDQGLPVFGRLGGGSAVLLDEDCISFAVIRPSRDLTAWRSNFFEMMQGVRAGLRILGIAADFGEAPGSYCPGPYDLVVDGKKVAGVAQAIRGGYAMVSGMIMVHQDPVKTTGFIEDFYRHAGQPTPLDASAVTRLDRLASVTIPDVFDGIVQGIRRYTTLCDEPMTEQEMAMAKALYDRRRIG